MTPLYVLGKLTVGLSMKYGYRPRVDGLENIPSTGGAILAANHLSVADQLFLGSVVGRQVHDANVVATMLVHGVVGRLPP